MTFHAVLYGCNDTSVNRSQFTYVWSSTAQMMTNKLTTRGGCSSQISQYFGNDVPGLYTMSVKVEDGTDWPLEWVDLCIKGQPKGLATTVFNLTGERHFKTVMSSVISVSLNRLLVGCGTTPRRQSGYLVGFCLFIRVIYTMLPPHGHWLILP